jgi:hypothetical protein
MQQAIRMICGKRELKAFFRVGEKKLKRWIREYGCPIFRDESGQYRGEACQLAQWYEQFFRGNI